MKILSIHDGHNASAALFDDGNLISCVSEERLNREKVYWGFPSLSIDYVLKFANCTLEEIDVVTVSHLNSIDYIKRKLSSRGTYTLRPKIFLGHLFNIYTAMKREWAVRKIFHKKGKKKYFFCDHHLAHAASALYYSGFDNALVVTIDGQGDGLSHTAYSFKNDKWELLTRGESLASLGTFYAAITEALGFKPNRHEGKVVGLAAMGNSKNIKLDEEFVLINDDKLSFKRMPYKAIIDGVKNLLEKGYSREDISAYAQDLIDEYVVEHVNKLCSMTGMKNIALAGGVFANVKLNQRIAEKTPIEKLFVQPGMGDEGLVLGSAAYYLHRFRGININNKMKDVYLGNSYSDDYIENLLSSRKYKYDVLTETGKKVASLIDSGNVIGWFDGAMEFGPRALGHRTMMADPRKKEINDILNKRLKRSEFMPFAPSVLWEKADEVFDNVEASRHSAEFMTITYNVKEAWRDKIKAVVHVDNTARPQLVKKEVNRAYYEVINEFFKITGIPLIVNTSFNIHEEPIVCSPEDALKSFDEGAVDYVVFNNRFLVYQK